MIESKNWKAQVIPSFDGSEKILTVTGEVQSAFVPPRLVASNSGISVPANAIGLSLENAAPGATMTTVSFSEDIIHRDHLEMVIVFAGEKTIVAVIPIDRSIVS